MIDNHAPEPRADAAPTSRRRGKTMKITVAALVTVGLASAGVVAASAAAASGPGGSGTSPSAAPSAGANPTGAPTPPKPRPHIDGTVQSVSGDVVTVKDPDGFTRTIDVTSGTTYTSNGKSTDEDALTSGRFLHAEGTVDSDGTTLDATSIVVMAPGARLPGPGGMPSGPGGKAPAAPKGGKAPAAPKGGRAPAAPKGGKAPAAAPTTGSTAHGS